MLGPRHGLKKYEWGFLDSSCEYTRVVNTLLSYLSHHRSKTLTCSTVPVVGFGCSHVGFALSQSPCTAVDSDLSHDPMMQPDPVLRSQRAPSWPHASLEVLKIRLRVRSSACTLLCVECQPTCRDNHTTAVSKKPTPQALLCRVHDTFPGVRGFFFLPRCLSQALALSALTWPTLLSSLLLFDAT